MKAKVNIDTRKCVGRFGPKYSKAQQFLDNEVLRDCTPYVPMRTGNLFMSGITGTKIAAARSYTMRHMRERCITDWE